MVTDFSGVPRSVDYIEGYTDGANHEGNELRNCIIVLSDENKQLVEGLKAAKWFMDHVMGEKKRVDWGNTFDMDWGKVNQSLLAVAHAAKIAGL